jgi:hypothetical protein
MTTNEDTKEPVHKSTPATDEEIAERIRVITSDPATPEHVTDRINRLCEVLNIEAMNSAFDITPELLAEHYRQAAPNAETVKARRAKAEIIALVERYAPDADAELEAFAHHMSEALRIARTSDSITTRFYHPLGKVWSECVNEFKCYQDASLTESAEFIRLALRLEKELEKEAEQEGGE